MARRPLTYPFPHTTASYNEKGPLGGGNMNAAALGQEGVGRADEGSRQMLARSLLESGKRAVVGKQQSAQASTGVGWGC